ncbi:DUF3073 domain-containing protein [Nakamurella endophytica]|uniref:DUF3073 domain-containing protein n=1 Tax=Nakamurella endophytica TaxID=1748367 RepID=A0A917T3N9_9ACTN|nr:DUF3073 domain-containing protein [Nakamurella endophytica]GGM09120.1 hypothetical protein GCM10011594_31290 [Nakamurella endophytica]
MGRGRQKAKQTKVARDLKYHVSDLDARALQRELSGAPLPEPTTGAAVEDIDDDDEDYTKYLPDDDDEPAGGYASRSSRR